MMKKRYYKFMMNFYKGALYINSGFGKCINAIIKFLEKGQALSKRMQK